MRRADSRPGERPETSHLSLELMQAVLDDGIRALLSTAAARNARTARRWHEELAWLTSRDCSQPFAFERLCDALGIEADVLRRRTLLEVQQVLLRTAVYSLTTPRGTKP